MAKIELIGGHIGSKLIIEMAKIEINRQPYCHYANYRDGQNKINPRLTASHKRYFSCRGPHGVNDLTPWPSCQLK